MLSVRPKFAFLFLNFYACTYLLTFLNIFSPNALLSVSPDIIASMRYSLLSFWTSKLNDRSFFENYPLVMSLKNLLIFAVFSLPSEFLIIPRNSVNSIMPDPSSSTKSIISCTSSLFSANPSPIRGSSNSSIPMEPEPSPSNELKHSFSFLIYLFII